MFLCAHCSFVPSVPLCLVFLCAHCSSVPSVPLCLLFLCAYCSSVPSVPLCLLFLCAYCSSMPTVPLCPVFLCAWRLVWFDVTGASYTAHKPLYWCRPLCVLIVVYLYKPSSNSTRVYASDMPSFEKTLLPARAANISSTLGSGWWSNWDT